MRHRIVGKQLSRSTPHRRAMRRNMAASLIEHGAIRTTEAKAKEVRRFIERLITIARKGTLHARRQVIAMLQDRAMIDPENPELLAEKTVVQRLFDEIAPRYADRPGGYTRIIHLSERRIGDAGRQVVLQLVEEEPAEERRAGPTRSARRKRAGKRADALKAALGKGKRGRKAAAEDRQEQPAEEAEAGEAQPPAQAEQAEAEGRPAAEDQAEPEGAETGGEEESKQE
jgi:large subunit ribosomal protein L17